MYVPQSIACVFFGQVDAVAGEKVLAAVKAARAKARRMSRFRMESPPV